MGCPLCAAPDSRPSWLGALRYRGTTYPYVECQSCGSLYAQPMPDEAALAQMYGPEYAPGSSVDYACMDDPKEPERIVRWLDRRPRGFFVDYGCGDGRLLSAAKAHGWRVMGVEFDPRIAQQTASRVAAPVADRFTIAAMFASEQADVLHLGDVVEHLTDPGAELPRILALVKPGGVLLAQGPLEGNMTLFTWVLKTMKRLRGSRVTDMAPYHVLLATAQGQRILFERMGLSTIEFAIHEVDWPAPSRLDAVDWLRPRKAGMFVVRRISRWMSERLVSGWGNRYFYVGQRV